MEDLIQRLEEQIAMLQHEIAQLSDEIYSQQKDISNLTTALKMPKKLLPTITRSLSHKLNCWRKSINWNIHSPVFLLKII